MSNNYRKKPQSSSRKSPPPRQAAGWVWLLTGVCLGAFGMFLLQLNQVVPGGARTPADSAARQADHDKNIPKPRFDFYKLLKENEVPVPVPESAQQAETPAPVKPEDAAAATQETVSESVSTPRAPQQGLIYMLQAGSFKRAEDADRLRVQLILLNLTARVEQVSVRNGDIWHRVLLGPYSSQEQMVQARDALAGNGINAIILKQNQAGG